MTPAPPPAAEFRQDRPTFPHANCGGTIRFKDWRGAASREFRWDCDGCNGCDPNGYSSLKEAVIEGPKYFNGDVEKGAK